MLFIAFRHASLSVDTCTATSAFSQMIDGGSSGSSRSLSNTEIKHKHLTDLEGAAER